MNYFKSCHDMKGVYLDVDKSVKGVIGYEPIELIGTSAYDYFYKDDLIRIVNSHINSSSENQVVEYRIRSKGGKYIWVSTLTNKRDDKLFTITKKLNIIQILIIKYKIFKNEISKKI